jgi:hypothetical protein
MLARISRDYYPHLLRAELLPPVRAPCTLWNILEHSRTWLTHHPSLRPAFGAKASGGGARAWAARCEAAVTAALPSPLKRWVRARAASRALSDSPCPSHSFL